MNRSKELKGTSTFFFIEFKHQKKKQTWVKSHLSLIINHVHYLIIDILCMHYLKPNFYSVHYLKPAFYYVHYLKHEFTIFALSHEKHRSARCCGILCDLQQQQK